MAQYLLRFDGFNDRVTSPSFGYGTASFAFEIDVAIDYSNTSTDSIFWNGGASQPGRILQFNLVGGTTLRVDNWGTVLDVAITSLPVPLSERAIYRFEDDVNGARLYQNGTLIGSRARMFTSGAPSGLTFTIGNRDGGASQHTKMDLYSLTIENDGAIIRRYDPSASNGTGTTLFDTQSNNNGTLVNFTVPDCWVLIPSAGITVTGATATYSYSPIAAAVSLTGEITVTGATGSYSYTAVSGVVDLTGEIVVTGATPNYSYSSINGVVTLTPAASIVVTGQTATYSYTPVSGVIDLTPEIQITGNAASYSYTAQGATVLLQGTISVTGQTSTYSYTAVNAFVSLNALEPVVNFSGTIKQASFAGFLRSAQFSGTIKQSSFSGTRKAAQFSGVRK